MPLLIYALQHYFHLSTMALLWCIVLFFVHILSSHQKQISSIIICNSDVQNAQFIINKWYSYQKCLFSSFSIYSQWAKTLVSLAQTHFLNILPLWSLLFELFTIWFKLCTMAHIYKLQNTSTSLTAWSVFIHYIILGAGQKH